jgi:hypothetical protein
MVIECKHVWDYIYGYLDDSLPPETKELGSGIWNIVRFALRFWIQYATSWSSPPTIVCLNCL